MSVLCKGNSVVQLIKALKRKGVPQENTKKAKNGIVTDTSTRLISGQIFLERSIASLSMLAGRPKGMNGVRLGRVGVNCGLRTEVTDNVDARPAVVGPWGIGCSPVKESDVGSGLSERKTPKAML